MITARTSARKRRPNCRTRLATIMLPTLQHPEL
ncbi:hypothetical protein ANCCAN_08970 [Ancylostoma caninum]|uniref:Uncharacterized protein n=1 Tax=Ancylostoma caninum TaxID=29170 RepID=A0A368GQ48_ANCCA|nr:hypothetical protein ANCCAN_08970 [Ancylostoma caninum]